MVSIECKDLSIGYNSKIVSDGINFCLDAGALAVLIGANGSGKSTLLRTLAGLQRPLSGDVLINGISLRKIDRRQLARQRAIVGTWRQGGGALSVEESVAVGRTESISWFGALSKADKAAVRDALETVGISSLAKRYLATLSDGEKQKVMIARALAQDTPIIFLDEPTAYLDVAARIDTMSLLQRLARQGKTIIMSTHDIAPAIARADYLMIADKTSHRVTVGETRQMINQGLPDKAFAGSGVHFDASILDFR